MWDDDNERKGEGETQCRLIACSSRKAPRGPPGLTSPSDGRIAINSTMCFFNINTVEGFGIKSRPVMYNLAIRKCTSPPLLAPKLKIFKWKFATLPGIKPWTCWARGRHATVWASAASLSLQGKFHFNNEVQVFIKLICFYKVVIDFILIYSFIYYICLWLCMMDAVL